MVTYTSRIWPNGEFTVGLVPKTDKDPLAPPHQGHAPVDEFNQAALRNHGFQATWDFAVGGDPLGLSKVPKNHNRSKRGQKGIPSSGCRMVRNAAYELERQYGLSRLGLLTLTLPALSPEDHASVHENWSSINRVFRQWLTRRLQSENDPGNIVGVYEIQEERLEKTGEVYLHAHILYPARDVANRRFQIGADEFRRAWERSVCRYTNSLYSFAASVDCAMLRKSAAGYLGKYCTKSRGFVNALPESVDKEVLPSSWYFLTNDLRRRVRRAIKLDALPAEWLMANGGQAREGGFLTYFQLIEMPPPKGLGEEGTKYAKLVVGCVGAIPPEHVPAILSVKRPG